MYGISSHGQDALKKVIEDLFDKIALGFIGEIPELKGKKTLVIGGYNNFSLAHLFVQSMGNKVPNQIERDMLKKLLTNSYGFIESLKKKTKAHIADRIDGLVREAKAKKTKLNESEVQAILDEEFKKAKSHMASIVEAESTKLRNLGSIVTISRMASEIGDDDPTVFFVVFRDNLTCKECIKLHLTPSGEPRLWKLSELKQGYHKRGEDFPSAFGLHPHCRCTLTYLTKGFGFEQGKLKFKSSGYDHFKSQRK